MTTTITSRSPAGRALSQRAERINTLHREATADMNEAVARARRGLSRAREAGEELLAVKEELPHGELMAWVADNFDGKRQTAQDYMRIAKHWDQITSAGNSPTSIRGALRMIPTERKPSPEAEAARKRCTDERLRESVERMRRENEERARQRQERWEQREEALRQARARLEEERQREAWQYTPTRKDQDCPDIEVFADIVQAGYRALSNKWHPDKPEGSHDRMQTLNAVKTWIDKAIAEEVGV